MKRRRTDARKSSGGSVTGGTGDIKPQLLTVTTGSAGAADDYTTASIALPVPRFGGSKNKATIFEFLWVDWYLGMQDVNDVISQKWCWLSTAPTRAAAETSTLTTSVEDVLDPRAFGFVFTQRSQTTSGILSYDFPIRVDLTDQNGNGYLVATDKLVVTAGAVANTAGIDTVGKIAYRLVDVGIEEYVGIVQSQTGIA